ncbi:MAG TPA: oligosaccharide flippase family protein [Polyangia bacterium]
MSVSQSATIVTASAPPDAPSLRGRMWRGSLFEVGGYGAQQALRLGSNLILSRLLFPAAFGLSSIVTLLLTGLVMLTDVAIQPCIIQSPRGDDPDFLNTAFTLQVLRGFTLAGLMIVLAWPAARFYREPALTHLIQFGALQLIINGFHSTSVPTLRRHLRLGWVNGLELGQTLVALPITLILARTHRSAWPLVIGMVVSALAYAIASHLMPVPYRNRFHWDQSAARELKRFGRWVVGSSAVGFLGWQTDRILMGRFLGAAWLGVYAIALNLSDAIGAVVQRLIGSIMYPVLGHAGRDEQSDVAALYDRMRRKLDLLSMTATGFLAGVGTWIVHALWDSRYENAGWILQILCVRVAIGALVSPGETCLYALGQTQYVFRRSFFRLLGAIVLVSAGWYLDGVIGVMWGVAATELFTGLAIWPRLRQLRILHWRRELLAVALFLIALAAGIAVRHLLPAVHLRPGRMFS